MRLIPPVDTVPQDVPGRRVQNLSLLHEWVPVGTGTHVAFCGEPANQRVTLRVALALG